MSWMRDLRCVGDTSECYEQVKDEREVLALRARTLRTSTKTNSNKDTCATTTETYFEILRLRSADTLTESDLFRDLPDILFED